MKKIQMNIIKGKSNTLVVDSVDEAINSNSFMADSYKKAGKLLNNYLCQSNEIINEIRSGRNRPDDIKKALYRSPQNTITFSGQRGSGKTSAMISFMDALNKIGRYSELEKRFTLINDCNFLVLDPIDPTTMEHNQNILEVVLSRLILKVQDLWVEYYDTNRDYNDLKDDKDKILRLSRECLVEINALKESEKLNDLADLQRFGDSSILKKNLFDLINLVFRFNSYNKDTGSRNVLVLSIDDTDCQISKAYDIIEDLRRYFTLPNVVIFMATDLDMMFQVVMKNFIDHFHLNIQNNEMELKRVENMTAKYMAKNFPPKFRIYLPDMDKLIRRYHSRIDLHYLENSNDKSNLLDNGTSLQSRVLNLVYKKTHLYFYERVSYINNLIPITIRGLSQLLDFLSDLEDTSVVNFDDESDLDSIFDDFQVSIDEFEYYFLNSWSSSKLNKSMRRILTGMGKQSPRDIIRYAKKEICEYYNITNEGRDDSYYELDLLMRDILDTNKLNSESEDYMKSNLRDQDINKVHIEMEDYYFIFAVRSMLAIFNTRNVYSIYQELIERNSNQINGFYSRIPSLPDAFYLDDEEIPMFYETNMLIGWLNTKSKYYRRDMSNALFKGFKNILSQTINLNADKKFNISELNISLLIFCNWDAQNLLRKEIIHNNKSVKSSGSLTEEVKDLYKNMIKAVGNANDGMAMDIVKEVLENSNSDNWMCVNDTVNSLIQLAVKDIYSGAGNGDVILKSLINELDNENNYSSNEFDEIYVRELIEEIGYILDEKKSHFLVRLDKRNEEEELRSSSISEVTRLADKCHRMKNFKGVQFKNHLKTLVNNLESFSIK